MLNYRILFFIALILFFSGCDRQPAQVENKLTMSTQLASLGAYPPVNVEMTLKKVSPHVYYVQGKAGVATDNAGFISNAAAIVTDEGVVIFDALGSPSLARKFLEKLNQVTDRPVVKVIVSHYHADHIYGLQVFEPLGVEIVAPVGAQNYIGSEMAKSRLEERRFSLDPWVNEKTHIVTPTRFISSDEDFTLGGIRFLINILGSAHSDGDLALFVETDRVLISGDIIFEGRVPFVGDANTKNWLGILRKMETSGLTALVPGHGPAAKNPSAAITLTRSYLEALRNQMGKAARELNPFAEAYEAADWSEFESLPAFDLANRRNAYQVFLSIEAEMAEE